ncbi:hypothetical protein LK09_05470 [Microbacterium mangrovi]|uniref:Uncharacterized protein n=1 Tax=Microbacterium mangrovi TaxID=1348253 RepID=A0A0B2A9X8_9MICO|nr:hypothetical protein [Microbacterium mangrovi]KHK98446.1 hypothetical protein LK09_05470 [Microbacterium mangrovi]
MTELVVEVHVPLVPQPGVSADEYPFPWIETVEEFLQGLEDSGRGETFDDGEELDDEYLFFVWQAPESELIALARRIADLPGVPEGVYAVVTDTESEQMGVGRRVEL